MVNTSQTTNRKLILASASPQRKVLLEDAGYAFEVQPSAIHEPDGTELHVGPIAFAEALSFLKARHVADETGGATVIGADTVVALDGCVYGKPKDAADARRILSTLMHHPHEVITGITLIDSETHRREITHDITRVTMRPMSDEQIDAYIESGRWEGKAGGYGIQDHDDAFVREIDGSFSNVVGLPMELVTTTLKRWGHVAEA